MAYAAPRSFALITRVAFCWLFFITWGAEKKVSRITPETSPTRFHQRRLLSSVRGFEGTRSQGRAPRSQTRARRIRRFSRYRLSARRNGRWSREPSISLNVIQGFGSPVERRARKTSLSAVARTWRFGKGLVGVPTTR